MPRTKVSKTSKRNREAAVREEKIREYERCLESYQKDIDIETNNIIVEIDMGIQKILETFTLHDEPIDNVLNFDNVEKIKLSEYKIINCSSQGQAITGSINDDGYITEESGNSTSSSALKSYLSMTQRTGRTQVSQLQTSQSRLQRRSRSACMDNATRSTGVTKMNSSKYQNSEHASRNKLRTPMSTRPKAISADRGLVSAHKSAASAFLRWPKPGESVVSINGSPLVAQVVPDRFANVNIPFKDGVLSLRPKRLEDLDFKIFDKFDDETLHQIKTLNENLGKIVSLASKNKS